MIKANYETGIFEICIIVIVIQALALAKHKAN